MKGWEEGEDDARSACPSDTLGYTRDTMDRTTGCDTVRLSQSYKPIPSSDRGLQLDLLKSESLVIAGQHTAVNTFSSLVLTARQVKEVGSTRRSASRGTKVNSMTGTKS
jgi:hypothetical protein